LQYPGIGGRMVVRNIKEISLNGMDWIDLVQDRDRWRALVNVIMDLRVP